MLSSNGVDWLAEYAEDGGDVAFRIGRSGDEVVAEWIGLVTLVARRDGSASRLEPVAGADARELAKVSRGGAQLLLRQLAGKVALHGAAVARDGRAVVLLGRSGQGKSTLAASLCVSGSAELLGDDAVAIDPSADGSKWVVNPLEQIHWLDADARAALGALDSEETSSGKSPVLARRHASSSAGLVAFVDLSFTSDTSDTRSCTGARLTRLSGVDALASLVPQAVRFVLDDPVYQKREVEALAALVEQVPIFRLERPRALRHDLLQAAMACVTELLRGDDRRSTKYELTAP